MTKLGLLLGSVMLGTVLLFSYSVEQPEPTEKIETVKDNFTRNNLEQYVTSVDSILPGAKKQISLLYSLGNYTFQVSKYEHNGKPVLYVEKGASGDQGKFEKRYYLKDERLAFYTEIAHISNQSRPYLSTKAYFNNNELFLAEQKSALTDSGLHEVSFRKTDLARKDQFSDLTKLENAIEQRGAFSLVFQGIAEYPKAKYLILGKEGFNTFRAPIRIENEDELIEALSSNPEKYRGERLDIDWSLDDTNEVIYESGTLSKN